MEVAFEPYKPQGYKQDNISDKNKFDQNEVHLSEQNFIQLCIFSELAKQSGEVDNYELLRGMALKVADRISNHNGVAYNYYHNWLRSRELLSNYAVNEEDNEDNAPTLADNTIQQRYLGPVYNQLDKSFKNGLKKEIFHRINSNLVPDHTGNSYVEYYTRKYNYDRDIIRIKSTLHRKK